MKEIPDNFKLSIEERHFRESEEYNTPTGCPIALALKEKFPQLEVRVAITTATLSTLNTHGLSEGIIMYSMIGKTSFKDINLLMSHAKEGIEINPLIVKFFKIWGR